MADQGILIAKHHDLQERLVSKNLSYTYFDTTPGDGACFFNAIFEVFKVPFYRNFLTNDVARALNDPFLFRQKLVDFMECYDNNDEQFKEKKSLQIISLRSQNSAPLSDNELWVNYLVNLRRHDEWANDLLIEMTPWFLNVNIKFISLDFNIHSVYTLNAKTDTTNTITLGTMSQVHFQSLIDISIFKDFKRCLGCQKQFKNVKMHLRHASACSLLYKPNFYLSFLDSSLKSMIATKNVHSHLETDGINSESSSKLATLYKKNNANRSAKFYALHRDEINKRKRDIYHSRDRLVFKKKRLNELEDSVFNDFFTDELSELKILQMPTLQSVPKKIMSPLQSVKAFLLETLWGAKFPCFVCHRALFSNGVKKLNLSSLECYADLDYYMLLSYKDDIKFKVNGSLWICHTCDDKIKHRKIPVMSAVNRLDCPNVPEFLKLSEIENALLCPMLLFMKLIKLPTSRMLALKDRVVNIPIPCETISANIDSLPRSLNQAQIIPIALRRKKSYINNYVKQFVNPEKLLQGVNYLKQFYPPYKNVDINYDKLSNLLNTSFLDTCEESVESISNEMLLNANDEIEDIDDNIARFQPEPPQSVLLLPDNLEDYVSRDTTAMHIVNNQTSNNSQTPDPIIFAPGEGQSPTNILSVENPFIKQFPGLFCTGEFGLNDPHRKVKISPQKFLMQRILNINTMFSKNKTFLFSAVFYLELYILMYRIRIAFMHGRFENNEHGRIFMKIVDAFQIFDAIPGSLRYWRTFRYELLARLEQLGIPILFYTLSMANLRWAANIATIVAKTFTHVLVMHKVEEVGVNVNSFMSDLSSTTEQDNYRDEDELEEIPENVHVFDSDLNLFSESSYIVHHQVRDCHYTGVCMSCTLHENCHRMTLTEFLNNLPPPTTRTSLHAESVLDEIKIMNHRLKSFRKHLLTSNSLPFNIEYYADRIEFQSRGYPHAHGLGWGNLSDIDKNFPGFKEAMQKAYLNETFTVTDMKILIKFADASICSSTNIDDIKSFGVSDSLAEQIKQRVKKFNVHKHSKSCQKFNNKCRFYFPKFPSIVTLISRPIPERLQSYKEVFKCAKQLLSCCKKVLCDINLETTELSSLIDLLDFAIPEITFDPQTKQLLLLLQNNEAHIIPAVLMNEILPFLPYNTNSINDTFTPSMLKVTVYHFCLLYRRKGTRVVHKRPLQDIWVNNFQPFFVLSWNGNHDVQLCFDTYAVVSYISQYVSKSETIASKALLDYYELIKGQNLSAEQQMYKLAQRYLMSRTISEAEAYYKIDPTLTYKQSNLKTVFLHAGFPKNKQRFLSKCQTETEEALGFLVDGHDGVFKEVATRYERYLERPQSLEFITFFQFVQMYDVIPPRQCETL